MSICHRITNRGRETVALAPFTHPEWALAAFGDDAKVRLRRADGAWTRLPLNPERRDNRDLEFAGDAKPVGLWELGSAVQPFVLRESFEADQVQHARLVLSRRAGHVSLQLQFKPQTLLPGDSVVLCTTWQFPSRTA